MNDIDPSARQSRLISGREGVTRFDALAPPATAMPDGNETLAWLAGNRMPERRKGMQAPSGATSEHAEVALRETRPDNPIEAAQKRASILADLNREAPNDPRVRSVFEADPIVAEDPSNGNLVTQQMLAARLDLFDAVLVLLGEVPLSRTARSRAALTLKTAYALLDEDAQVEWALSEVRLEEVRAFIDSRSEKDLGVLGAQLEVLMDREDLWAAARTFSMAAHLSVGQSRGSTALADLLEMREIDD